MSSKNHFKKHKSRKFRKAKIKSPQKNYWEGVASDPEEKGELDRVPERQKQNREKIIKAPLSKEEPEAKTENKDIASDCKKVLTTFLGFAILLLVLWIIKIKTSLFDIAVDYFYKIFAL